jgi:hypothetical protein
MNTEQVAKRLVELCKLGKFVEAQKELYAEDAKSVEPTHAQGFQSVQGLDKILEKSRQFENMVEAVHGFESTEPIILGNHISVGMTVDATMKGMGRTKMEEIGVYEVKDGKIVREEFFY